MPDGHEHTIDIRRLRAQDPQAFEAVVRTYYDRVYRLALRMLGNATDAEDLVQEAFLRVHRNAPRFRADASVSTWVYRITHNLCIDELRRRKRRHLVSAQSTDEESPVPEPADTQPGPEELALGAEESRRLRAALESLPIEYRSVLVLREVEDLSYDQIAAILKCPVGTVRSRLARGRRALAERLQRSDEHELQERVGSSAALR